MNLTSNLDPKIDNLPEGVGDNDDWDFNGAGGGYSAQRVGVRRKSEDFQGKCLTKKQNFLANLAEAVEVA